MIRAVLFDYTGTIADYHTGELLPGVPEMLTRLRKEYAIGLLTRLSQVRYESLGVGPLFHAKRRVEFKSSTDFEEMMLELGSTPAETLIVGDELHLEIYAAMKLKAPSVWVAPEPGTIDAFEAKIIKPSLIVRSVLDILPWLDAMRGKDVAPTGTGPSV